MDDRPLLQIVVADDDEAAGDLVRISAELLLDLLLPQMLGSWALQRVAG